MSLLKDIVWNWLDKGETLFQRITNDSTSELSSSHFDLNLEIVVATNASENDIGSVILRKY